MILNPADPRPLYQQLAAALREQISIGELAPGRRIPTESQLAHDYGASRNTVRLALAALKTEGLVVSHRGRGHFVRVEPPLKYHAHLTGSRTRRLEEHGRRDTFSQQVESQGRQARQVSTPAVVDADETVASLLGVHPGEPVGLRRRVMYADETPVQLGDSYYPLDIVRDSKIMQPADVTEGTDQVLEDLGHSPTRYADEITWRMPSADEATTLRMSPGIPIGRLQRVTYDQHGRPVEVYVAILPADRHVLLYEVDAG